MGVSTLHASNIKGKMFEFACTSHPVSCVDWALASTQAAASHLSLSPPALPHCSTTANVAYVPNRAHLDLVGLLSFPQPVCRWVFHECLFPIRNSPHHPSKNTLQILWVFEGIYGGLSSERPFRKYTLRALQENIFLLQTWRKTSIFLNKNTIFGLFCAFGSQSRSTLQP